METKTSDTSDAKRVLASMVVDTVVCSRIASQWTEDGLFASDDANMIARWCIQHLDKYGSAPNGQIRSIFDRWVAKATTQEKHAVSVERTLFHLSDIHDRGEELTSEYVLDLARKYFSTVRMRRNYEVANDDLQQGNVDAAYQRMNNLGRVEMGTGALIKPSEDYVVWREAFDREEERSLISYPGKLDGFLGRAMVRDSLIAFMGPDKCGKSFLLMDAAFRAIRNGHRVAFFEVVTWFR
jgi:hypothetical protein